MENKKKYPPEVYKAYRPEKNEGKHLKRSPRVKKAEVHPELKSPEIYGIRQKEKHLDENLYAGRERYKIVEYDEKFLDALKDCSSFEEKLRMLYRRFSEFESQDKQGERGFVIKPHRFFKGEGEHTYNGITRSWMSYAEHTRALFIQNEIKLNILSYHPAFVKLDRIEFEDIPDFKKYVQSLETTDWKSKYMRANNNGFITYKDYVIIWNKFGEKKNGNALISKLIFTDKE